MTRPQTTDRLTRVVRRDAVAEVSLRQRVLRDPDAARLRAELVALHEPGNPPRIILSLRGLSVLAAPCIATLAELAQALAAAGGSLVLINVPEPAARMLKRTGLARTLPVARSADHAQRLSAPRKTTHRAA